MPPPRIVCLTNVFDQQYHERRDEDIARCLSSPKRRDLFQSLEIATGLEVLVLSSPPKAIARRRPRWLAGLTTRFSTHQQRFCGVWDSPKIRVPWSWASYTSQVVRHTRPGDLVVLDNYELLYVLAAVSARARHQLSFILDFEDGKHAIDRSWARLLSGVAEALGRRMIAGAILAHPALRLRLPAGLPYELVPGFIRDPGTASTSYRGEPLRLLYAGSLDQTRGVDLLMRAMDQLPLTLRWQLDITGSGPLEEEVRAFASRERQNAQVRFHGSMAPVLHEALLRECHVGLNCQRDSDPISEVTFPSKVFTYLSSGLHVLSSRASEITSVCGPACSYYEEETPASLAKALAAVVQSRTDLDQHTVAAAALVERYSISGTAQRLRSFLERANLLQ